MTAAEVAQIALALWPAWVALAVAAVVGVHERARQRAGHRPDAYGCRYWTGDRAGVDLSATCPLCPARRNPYAAPADVVEWRRRHYPQERP